MKGDQRHCVLFVPCPLPIPPPPSSTLCFIPKETCRTGLFFLKPNAFTVALGGVCTHATAFDQKSFPVTQMTQAEHACAGLQGDSGSLPSTCLSSRQTSGCTARFGPRQESGLWLSKFRLNKLGPCWSCLGFTARYKGSLPGGSPKRRWLLKY